MISSKLKQYTSCVFCRKNARFVSVRARFSLSYEYDGDFNMWCDELNDYHSNNIFKEV